MSLYISVFVFGSLIGSFLNVCIFRIPRNMSIVFPSSRCPSCGIPVKAIDNVPLLSYVFLRGRCRYCREGISLRYPLVEALNAVLYACLLWRFGLSWAFMFYCVFVSSLIVITFIDLDFQIIPDRITLGGIPIGLMAGSLFLPDPFMRASLLGFKASIAGFIAGGGFFYLVAVLSRGGMGGGDIKMMAMVGSILGWKGVFLTTLAGSLTGSVVGGFLMIFKGQGRKTKIPFGPFLAFGSLVSLFFGQELFLWYLY